MRRFLGTIVIVIIFVSPAVYAQGDLFEDCGTLIQGVECVLFDSDNFGVYVLDNLGGFGIGDRVRVAGVLNETCVTFCMEGDGCIENATVEACAAIPTLTEWGLIIFGVVLLGFITWVFLKRRRVIGVRL